LIPVSLDALLRAIELNGVEIDKNKHAFTWGRIAAVSPERMQKLIHLDGTANDDESLEDAIQRRADFLVDYQNQALADRYSALVEQVRKAEQEVDGAGDLADAVARSYFKLLSYKDEYEVARLHTQTGFLDSVRRDFGKSAKVRFHLAPPLLYGKKDARGRPRKKEFGAWMVPAFRLIASMRRLRGSKLDVFGFTAERRMERVLIVEFEETVDKLLAALSKNTIGDALIIVRLYMDIRGFGPVKEQAVREVRENVAKHLGQTFGTVNSGTMGA